MEVLSTGGWVVECPNCHSFLKISKKDLKVRESRVRYFGTPHEYIACEVCGNELDV